MVESALQQVEAVVDAINERARQVDQLKKLEEIEARLDKRSFRFELAAQLKRALVREGLVRRPGREGGAPLQLYLFNDFLLLTKTGGKRERVQRACPLLQVRVRPEPADAPRECFVLEFLPEGLTTQLGGGGDGDTDSEQLLAPDAEQKSAWVREIGREIGRALDQERTQQAQREQLRRAQNERHLQQAAAQNQTQVIALLQEQVRALTEENRRLQLENRELRARLQLAESPRPASVPSPALAGRSELPSLSSLSSALVFPSPASSPRPLESPSSSARSERTEDGSPIHSSPVASAQPGVSNAEATASVSGENCSPSAAAAPSSSFSPRESTRRKQRKQKKHKSRQRDASQSDED